MLLNNFFRIESLQQDDAAAGASPGPGITASVKLKLDPEHAIFKGHFPGRPVVPGACVLQLVQETTSLITGKEWRLLKGDQIKFIMAIDPRVSKTLQLTLVCKTGAAERVGGTRDIAGKMPDATAYLEVTAELSDDRTVCFKFKGTFRSV